MAAVLSLAKFMVMFRVCGPVCGALRRRRQGFQPGETKLRPPPVS
jgi:hypothetical protein